MVTRFRSRMSMSNPMSSPIRVTLPHARDPVATWWSVDFITVERFLVSMMTSMRRMAMRTLVIHMMTVVIVMVVFDIPSRMMVVVRGRSQMPMVMRVWTVSHIAWSPAERKIVEGSNQRFMIIWIDVRTIPSVVRIVTSWTITRVSKTVKRGLVKWCVVMVIGSISWVIYSAAIQLVQRHQNWFRTTTTNSTESPGWFSVWYPRILVSQFTISPTSNRNWLEGVIIISVMLT